MRIGLLAVDGHNNFPNLALMKLSAWHKNRGDTVEWASALFGNYDRVYKSKVFTFTPDDFTPFNCEVIKAGTGYKDYTSVLTDEQEHTCPDYSLYPDFDCALGFATRGCKNRCSWCVVPMKEGVIRENSDVEEFLDGRKKVTLLDNNILAHPHGIRQLIKLSERELQVDCNQGLDARLVDDDMAQLLSSVRWQHSRIRFVADTSPMVQVVKRTVSKMRHAGFSGEFFIYCLIHGDIRECIDRVLELKSYDNKLYIHAQPYLDFSGKNAPPKWQKDLACYCNKRMIYKSVELKDFMPRKGFKFIDYMNLTNP